MNDPAVPAEPGWEPQPADLARSADPRVGTAYAVSIRSDANPRNTATTETVLTFRLRRVAPNGQLLPPVAVEMRGPVLTGMVAEGDQVRLPAPIPHGGALKLTTVTNLTTGSEVVAGRSGTSTGVRVVFAVVSLLVLVVVVMIVVLLLSGAGSG